MWQIEFQTDFIHLKRYVNNINTWENISLYLLLSTEQCLYYEFISKF